MSAATATFSSRAVPARDIPLPYRHAISTPPLISHIGGGDVMTRLLPKPRSLEACCLSRMALPMPLSRTYNILLLFLSLPLISLTY